MDKAKVAEILDEIGTLLELKGENPFKCRAYHNASRLIDGLQQDLGPLIETGKLGELKGIGEALTEKITELWKTDRLGYYEELKASLPGGLVQMISIPGFGPKRAQIVYKKLKVDSVEKLEAACKDGRVAALEGFGEKSQEKILQGIEQLRRFSGRHRYHKAFAAAQPILAALRDHPATIRCEVAGSLRRCRETIGDLDILVSAKEKDAPALMEMFVKLPGVMSVSAKGDTKSSVVLDGGIQADFRVVSDAQFPFALNYFTGSKEHNIALRGRALQRGLSLNEYGFSKAGKEKDEAGARDGGSVIKCRTEEEIYKALDLDYIPPELREDNGEIDAAEKGELPELIEKENLRGALHNHSTWTDGRETVEAMAEAARELGLDYFGTADHSKSEFQARGLKEEQIPDYLADVRKVGEKLKKHGFRVFAGIEADVLEDGSLDFSDKILAQFDYVVAAVHRGFTMEEKKMTARIVKAMANPHVTMLAHPTGRLLLSREAYAVDMRAVIEAAARHGVIIEINAHPFRLDMDWRWWKFAKQCGVKCAINADAHSIHDLQYLAVGVGIARKGWLTKADVINCLPANKVEAVLKARR
ncbi:MAG: DNA polymerase/3'-5' exonuclease PolX [Verrucomicrobia bacterium]|nr:DNA polymerase/3'-5' exonuclease PolX [Verrucomicrobiota bacterium]